MQKISVFVFLFGTLSLATDVKLVCGKSGSTECDAAELTLTKDTWTVGGKKAEPEDSPNDYLMLTWDTKGGDTLHFTVAKKILTTPGKKFEATLNGSTCKRTIQCERKN